MKFQQFLKTGFCLLLLWNGIWAVDTRNNPADSTAKDRFYIYLDEIKSNLFRPEIVRQYTDSLETFYLAQQKYNQSNQETVNRLYIWQKEYELPPSTSFQGKIFGIMTPIRLRGTLYGSLIQIGRDVIVDSGAVVEGEIICIFCHVIDQYPDRGFSGTRIIFDPVLFQFSDRNYQGYLNLFIRISFFLVFALLILKYRPGLIMQGQTRIRQMPLKSFLTGIMALLLFLPIIFLCIAMILGIPLIVPIVLFYFWAVLIGYITTGTIIADSLIRHFHLNISLPLFLIVLFFLLEFWIYGLYFVYQVTPIRQFFELDILIWIDVMVKLLLTSWGLGGYLLSLKVFNDPVFFPVKRK